MTRLQYARYQWLSKLYDAEALSEAEEAELISLENQLCAEEEIFEEAQTITRN